MVNNTAYAIYAELKGMRDVFNGQESRMNAALQSA